MNAALVAHDLVVRVGAADPGEREAVADLHSLHRLDAHQRRGQPCVEPVVLARVRAEARRHAGRANLDDAAERVAVLARLVDRLRIRSRFGQRVARDHDADVREQRLRDGAGSDVHGGVARGCPLERVADVGQLVLLDAREVGMAGPRQRDRLHALAFRLALGGPRIHPPRPVLVVAVADDERERRPERPATAESCEHLDLVRLDLLARRAAVALLPPTEVGVDRLAVERQPGRQAGEDRHERRPVRLSRRCKVERHAGKPKAVRITLTGAGVPVHRSKLATPCRTRASRPSMTAQPAARAACTSAVSPSPYASSTTV